MSHLSNRRLELRVLRDAVRLTLCRRWPRPKKLAQSDVRHDAAAGAGAGAGTWATALHEGLAALARQVPIAGARLHVQLSDALVHFDVVQGDFADKSARQLHSFAQACAAELLGERVNQHTLRWQLQCDERHLLLCAVPDALLEALKTAAHAHGLSLASCEPSFVAQWNAHARGALGDAVVFAVATGLNAMIACVRDGAITAVSNGPWFAERHCAASAGLLARQGMTDAADRSTLDLQVDRLLASHGFDAAEPWAFVVVRPRVHQAELSARWTMLPAVGGVQ